MAQYLSAGSQAVWLIYPELRIVEVHDSAGSRNATEQGSFSDQKLFGEFKFAMSMGELFDENSLS